MNAHEVVLGFAWTYIFLWVSILVTGTMLIYWEGYRSQNPDGIREASRWVRVTCLAGAVLPILVPIIVPLLILYLLSPLPEIRERMRRKTQ